MKQPATGVSRELRIELLRARAALERQRLSGDVNVLAQFLTPSAIVKGLLPQSLSEKKPSDWLMQGVSLLRRYPFLVSGASTLFSGVSGKRHRLLRLGAGALLGWEIIRTFSGGKRNRR